MGVRPHTHTLRAMLSAEDRYREELVRQYGLDAPDARLDSRALATDELRRRDRELRAARADYFAKWKEC